MSRKTDIPTDEIGTTATVRHLDNVEAGRRLKVSHPDGREWVVVLGVPDGGVEVEVSRRHGVPDDVPTPEWLTNNLSRMARPA